MSRDQASGTPPEHSATPADKETSGSTEQTWQEIRERISKYYRISTRQYRAMGDSDWEQWAAIAKHAGLGPINEMRTVDSFLNPTVGDSGSYFLGEPSEAWDLLEMLPKPEGEREYYLLVFDAMRHPAVEDPSFRLLGYDLSDETMTSSLLNCGIWQGGLAPIAQRCQPNGLLTLDDAREAQRILPQEWGNDPHSRVFVWALYQFTPELG